MYATERRGTTGRKNRLHGPRCLTILYRIALNTMTTSIKLDDELKGRVQHLAGLRQRSAHWIMREAIQQYVEREEAHESFKREALVSQAAYQQTGRHLTGDETRTWLRTWGADEGMAIPECHE